MSFKCESPLPGEHPEYSLGFAFSLLLCEILFVPEVGLHLVKDHASYSSKGVFSSGGCHVHGGLFCRCGMCFGNVLLTVMPMSTAMELTFPGLVLWLLEILDAVSF